ncbi:MAG: hypothetical protein VB934_12515, partial [Polyangiaceae bacterium]
QLAGLDHDYVVDDPEAVFDGGSGSASASAATSTAAAGGELNHVPCDENCECNNDTCNFICTAPPCHVDCGSGSNCTGECANATCTCSGASTCAFECVASDCKVLCNGNSSCALNCGQLPVQSAACKLECKNDVTVCPDNKTVVCNSDCP